MKKFHWLILGLSCLNATLFSCDSENKLKHQISNSEKTHQHYQCIMKCEGDKTYDKAGQCPVCNMNLEEVVSQTKDSLNTDKSF